MKSISVLVLMVFTALAQTPAIHNVYILPMAGGLDQYLAGQITRDHVMRVVADPKSADVMLTDRLGESFEAKMAKIHPRDEDDDDAAEVHPAFHSGGARGTIFLVDAKSRQVLWSDYQKMSRSTSANVMNREAAHIAKKLQTTFAK